MSSEIEVFLTELNSEQQREEDFFGSPKSICCIPEYYKQLFWKTKSLMMFEDIIARYNLDFGGKVLELGGGYGIHAAYIKARYKDKVDLVYSDVSMNALKASQRSETFFGCSIDKKWRIEAENIPAPENYFDSVFFFASFHHLQNQARAIEEVFRVLKVGGRLMLILEPSSPKLWQNLFKLHTKRELIEEKVFTKREYRDLLRCFSRVVLHDYLDYFNRESRRSMLYYLFLNTIGPFRKFFPCSQVIIAEK